MVKVIRDLANVPTAVRGGAVTVGNFDGVHKGHAALLAELGKQAKRVHGAAVILTFDPPPLAILQPNRPLGLALTTIERRAELAGALGVDWLVAYPTDRALLSLSAEEFFDRIIVEKLASKAVVEGPNFRFGKDRGGDVSTLRRMCGGAGMELSILEPTSDDSGEMVSSTRIRKMLAEGKIGEVNACLTQPYQIAGTVAEGAKRGRQMGFPTANLSGCQNLLPAQGVYAGKTEIDGRWYTVALNVGPNPTFADMEAKVEAHIVGFDGNLYGEPLAIELHAAIRAVQKFSSMETLKEQIAKDILECTAAVASLID